MKVVFKAAGWRSFFCVMRNKRVELILFAVKKLSNNDDIELKNRSNI